METNENNCDDSVTTSSDDSVTIVEALKRLGTEAPARQSFDAAVKKGKIRKVTDKSDNPNGRRMVSWASVLEYMERGGFQQCSGAGRGTERENEARAEVSREPELPASSITNQPVGNDNNAEAPTPSEPESPAVVPATVKVSETHAKDSDKRHQATPEQPTGKQRGSAPVNGRAKPKTNVQAVEKSDAKGARRTRSLRSLKDSLRHLDFEGTKAIRDWADNRLLTVLRPAISLITNLPEAEPNMPS